MGNKSNNEAIIRRYLLGSLESDQLAVIERRLISDEEFFDQLVMVEDELTDEYLRDMLSARERWRFETRFLVTPERYERLRFARTLRIYVAKSGNSENSISLARNAKTRWWKGIQVAFWQANSKLAGAPLAVTALVAFTCILTLFLPILRQYRSPNVTEATQSGSQGAEALQPTAASREISNEPTATQPPVNPSRRSKELVASLVLTAGSVRGSGETRRLVIPADPNARVRLILQLSENDYSTYQAELVTNGGESVHRSDQLKPKSTRAGRTVEIDVKAGLFRNDDYSIVLTGVGPDGESEAVEKYRMRALKKRLHRN